MAYLFAFWRAPFFPSLLALTVTLIVVVVTGLFPSFSLQTVSIAAHHFSSESGSAATVTSLELSHVKEL